MIKVKGINGESLVLDGEWVEKLRAGEPRAKLAASSYRSAEVTGFERRRGLFRGGREQLVQAVLTFAEPPFVSITVPRAERGPLDELLAELERRRGLSRLSAAGPRTARPQADQLEPQTSNP